MTRVYGWLTAILAAVAGVFLYGRRQRAVGVKEGSERVSRRAVAAAEAREAERDEINDRISDGGSNERLLERWSRD